jgi:hypothetical protein
MDFTLAASILFTSASLMTVSVAFLKSLPSLMAVFVCNGFTLGFFETGAYIVLLQVWGHNAVPFMQVLIAMIGIGSLLAPVIAEPFLIKQEDSFFVEEARSWDLEGWNTTSESAVGQETMLIYPYSFIAAVLAFNALFSLSLYCKYGSSIKGSSQIENTEVHVSVEDAKKIEAEFGSLPPSSVCCAVSYKNIVIALAVILIHLFYGIQVCFGSFLMTFSVNSSLNLSKSTGALLTTIYWSSYTFFKLPVMLLMRSNGKILMMSLTGVLTASILLMMSEMDERILWTGVVLLAASMSPVWACVFGYLQEFFPVTETVSSLLVISSMMAEFVFPSVISAFIASQPLVLVYITFSCAVSMLIIFVVVMIVCNKKIVQQ